MSTSKKCSTNAETCPFRRQQRHRSALAWCFSRGRKPEVIEEARRIAVVAIDLIPNAGAFLGGEIAREQRGLARTRRAMNPHNRPLLSLVQTREQPIPENSVGRLRSGQLRELGRGLVFGTRGVASLFASPHCF
jgi:hypothetical protein